MISFTAAIILLILGYIFYGAFVEKVFGANNEIQTPANQFRYPLALLSMVKPNSISLYTMGMYSISKKRE